MADLNKKLTEEEAALEKAADRLADAEAALQASEEVAQIDENAYPDLGSSVDLNTAGQPGKAGSLDEEIRALKKNADVTALDAEIGAAEGTEAF